MEPFIGEILIFGFNFAPRGWARCEGQLLAIASNTALFSLLGTTYGGDGRTSFGLPDLRSRAAIGMGQGPGLSNYRWGQSGGAESHTLTVGQMPSHSHTARASNEEAEETNAQNNVFAGGLHFTGETADVNMSASAITPAGGNQSFGIRNPYLALNYCIALVGIYPSRS